jgi:hypothetical protein
VAYPHPWGACKKSLTSDSQKLDRGNRLAAFVAVLEICLILILIVSIAGKSLPLQFKQNVGWFFTLSTEIEHTVRFLVSGILTSTNDRSDQVI